MKLVTANAPINEHRANVRMSRKSVSARDRSDTLKALTDAFGGRNPQDEGDIWHFSHQDGKSHRTKGHGTIELKKNGMIWVNIENNRGWFDPVKGLHELVEMFKNKVRVIYR